MALPNNFVFVFIYHCCDTIDHTKQIGICIYLPIVVMLLALPNNYYLKSKRNSFSRNRQRDAIDNLRTVQYIPCPYISLWDRNFISF